MKILSSDSSAEVAGYHLSRHHPVLMRMPIKNTVKGDSVFAVYLPLNIVSLPFPTHKVLLSVRITFNDDECRKI
jgi:hypothetical protein